MLSKCISTVNTLSAQLLIRFSINHFETLIVLSILCGLSRDWYVFFFFLFVFVESQDKCFCIIT